LVRRLALGLVFRAFCGILALDNARGLSAPAAQIVELGAAHLAAANDLDRIDHRRVKRKDALDAFAVGNLAHREVLVQPRSGAADAHAFVGLHTGAVAFDDLDVDDQRIPRLEIGDFLAGRKLRHLFVFDLLEQVHGEFSIGCAAFAPFRLA